MQQTRLILLAYAHQRKYHYKNKQVIDRKRILCQIACQKLDTHRVGSIACCIGILWKKEKQRCTE